MRISWLGKNQVSVVRINECPCRFHLPKPFGNFHGKVHRVKNVFHLTQVPFVYAFVTKIQAGSTDIAVNSLELPVIPCENSWMEHAFSPEIFQRENRTTFLKFQLFPGTFQWYAQKTCLPWTSQLEFSEFLSKWKAPHITHPRTQRLRSPVHYTCTLKGKVSRFCACSEFLFLFILSQNQTMRGE